jgi:hypothetical protein
MILALPDVSFLAAGFPSHLAPTLSGMQLRFDLHQHARRSARDHGMLVRFALASRWAVRRGLPNGGIRAAAICEVGQGHCSATLMSAFGGKADIDWTSPDVRF